MFYSDSVFHIRFYVLILCATYFNNVDGVTSVANFAGNETRYYGRYRRQTVCPEKMFNCDSGECINEDNVCDGREDCRDGSDENDCLNIPCNQFLFKCKYGACINKQLECDGNKDCKDNSDETSPNCKNHKPVTVAPNSDCSINNFQCNSGQCIDESGLCDGVANCDDTSDESEESCSTLQCPKSTHRCKYGACVRKNAKCDGVKDCFDGSDEASCPTAVTPTKKPVTAAPPTPKPVTKPPGPAPPGSCVMPSNPQNGVYTVGETPPGTHKPGAYIPQYNVLVTKCNNKYNPSPPDRSTAFCALGKWSPSPPTCGPSCEFHNSTKTTNVTCTFEGRQLESCEYPVEGTFATLTCETLHEDPSITQNPFRVCRDGSWDRPFTQCYPVCGQKRPEGITNIINGTIAKQGDYPWHIGVYRSATKENICGGSILKENVAISAAHCFTNADNGYVYPKENYLVAAGKYYRTYDDPRDKHAQYSAIDAIYIPSRYKGSVNQYEGDVAVLVLRVKLTLSITVQPVCLDWSTSFEYQQISGNNKGVVVGWGQTVEGDQPSEVLKELSVPVIPYEHCFEQVPKAFRRFLTYDKVCAGFLDNATAVCQGDSGGGLAFAASTERYFIRGVVSTSPATIDRTCDSNQYGTYTLISKHIDFIKQYGL